MDLESIGTGAPLVVDLWSAGSPVAGVPGCDGTDVAALVRAGAPIRDGFSLTEAACRGLMSHDEAVQGLWTAVERAVERLERRSGLRLGDPARPLLLSVLSCPPGGAHTRIPGIGLNDEVAAGLAERAGGGFAAAAYRQLVRAYGRAVLGVDPSPHEHEDTPAGFPMAAVAGHDLPQDPATQLRRALDALGGARRAGNGREPLPSETCSLAVVQLVSGQRDARSGSGVAYGRSPVSGAGGLVGEYLAQAPMEDLRRGSRRPLPLTELRALEPEAHATLTDVARRLEIETRETREIEFVVESGRLWVLRSATAESSPEAAFRIAASLVDEGLIGLDEALRHVDGAQLQRLLRPGFRPDARTDARTDVVATGVPASPGAVVGRLALDGTTASTWAAQGITPVLALVAPGPAELEAIDAAEAVVTDQAALASPTAVRARRRGIPCVAALEGMTIDTEAGLLALPGGIRLEEGGDVSLDGTVGTVCTGRRELRPSGVALALHAPTAGPPDDPTVRAVQQLLEHADRRRRVQVHANAEAPEEARIARRLGAQGIGLLRTEHLLFGPRRELVERLVTGEQRDAALTALESLMAREFTAILEAMDGLPVVVRLLDPPLHEFLPDVVDLSVQTALAEERGERDEQLSRRLLSVRRWHETNPLLGLRGVRILTVLPQIVDVQVRALAGATIALRTRGLHPRPQIMIPLVAEVAELVAARERVDRVVADMARAHEHELRIPVGVMIELPRAALTAAAMAGSADFFSFGTNDLTQTVWGISHDDAQASFLTAYREEGILRTDPFVRIDEHGVGRLVRLAAEEGRAASPALGLGACGRHVEDPGSVGFFTRIGLDYLSCSPPNIPVVRLESGRQAVLDDDPSATPFESR